MVKINNYGLGIIPNAILSELAHRAARADDKEVSIGDIATMLDVSRDDVLRTIQELCESGNIQRTCLLDWAEIDTFIVNIPIVSVTPLQMSLTEKDAPREGLDRLVDETSVDIAGKDESGENVTFRVAIVPEDPSVPKGSCLLTVTQVVDGQPVDDHRMVCDRLRLDTVYDAIKEAKRMTGTD